MPIDGSAYRVARSETMQQKEWTYRRAVRQRSTESAQCGAAPMPRQQLNFAVQDCDSTLGGNFLGTFWEPGPFSRIKSLYKKAPSGHISAGQRVY